MAGLPEPSAPWQDLQDLAKTSCPAFASAAEAPAAQIVIAVNVIRIIRMLEAPCRILLKFVRHAERLQDLRRRLVYGQRLVASAAVLGDGFLVRCDVAVVVTAEAAGIVR